MFVSRCLISLTTVCSRFIDVIACVRISFLFKTEYSIVHIYILFIHSYISEYFELLPPFGHSEKYCYKDGCKDQHCGVAGKAAASHMGSANTS